MAIKAIAFSYWRRIKDNARSYASIPSNVKEDVLALARIDVERGEITVERYVELIGEEY